jgi:hypothetical protein
MNAIFRRNLTAVLSPKANDVRTAPDTGGALDDDTDRARFCRTTATCIWGVSDPRKLGAGPRSGGGRGGRSRPKCLLTPARARAAGYGRLRAPPVKRRAEPVHREEHRPIHLPRDHAESAVGLVAGQCTKRGTTAPKSVVPPPFLAALLVTGHQTE